MPIYEYDCEKCKKRHELTQKMADAPLETCPDCGGKVNKIISMTSFQLKGTGWYATDYKKGNSPKPVAAAPAATAEAAAPAPTPPAGPKKSES